MNVLPKELAGRLCGEYQCKAKVYPKLANGGEFPHEIGLFGSYGWGDGEWMRNWEETCQTAGEVLVCDNVTCNEAPDENALEEFIIIEVFRPLSEKIDQNIRLNVKSGTGQRDRNS